VQRRHPSLVPTLAAGLVLAISAASLRAQPYPARPVKILVGASPGGTTDTLAREIAQDMTRTLGRPVIVENKAGAGGNLAADAVAKSPPDGYTLLVSFTSHAINATLYPQLPFDPVADFTAISMIATVPSILVAGPRLSARSVSDVIAAAKAKPDGLTFAIGGIGSSVHLAGEQFKMRTGVAILNVPYKGTSPAMTDVLGGQVDMMFASVVTATPHIKAAKLRALGVTSAQRLALLPDVPAIAETVPGFESRAWFGLFGPARLPPEITATLHRAVATALRTPEIRARLEQEGATPVGSAPAEFSNFVREDVKRWAPIVKASGAKPE
jgi:tripartite-type tricarboxylate transporter receptor subunit TctC